ncbi:1-acyl-sn-glycerol-3-phosphate acyltransferase [Methylobacillus gramineus]|uniref:lysophospholipid acyltransferase family protein n=1 Tax=Methylobacillus gramineus TaxID=755169 RepID=UPI001CFF641B|nr:lysophospholipid acyltransferase family protein [Methylobacillus gramineus]MCB5185050.1 1-acyl-sn-glycerol-3-phosphate acyltransferase [Methylobacillus gramineus]
MIYLRSLIYTLGMWIFTPIFTTSILLTFPLPRRTRYIIISGWARSMLWWLRITCGLSYRVIGRENIPITPSIILCKHQSAWETLALQQIFPPQVWVLKRELLWIPFFGWGLALTSPIAINRAAGREALKQLVSQGKERLKQRFFVVIFPEGTRLAPGTRGKYHIGGAWLATHTKSTVVPVAHNAGEYWPKNSFLKRPGTITLSIGNPIDAAGLKPDQLNQLVENWIEQEMLLLDSR